MQKHWVEWGPPVYVPVAGYFKIGSRNSGKRQSRSTSDRGIPDKPDPPAPAESEIPPVFREGRGDLNDLVSMFGGVIR